MVQEDQAGEPWSSYVGLYSISRSQDLIKPLLTKPTVTWARPHYHHTCYLNSTPSRYLFPPIFDAAGSYSLLLHSLLYDSNLMTPLSHDTSIFFLISYDSCIFLYLPIMIAK